MRPLAALLLPLALLGAGSPPRCPAQEAGAAPADAPPAAAQGQEPAVPEDLVRATLGEDIDTAGYYELIAWCRQLGLADTGSTQDLRSRLYSHYGLKQAVAEERAAGRVLEIMSARATEYFTIEEVDENNVLLQGDVLVELREKEVVHRIRAQKVLLNQSANLLTAEGGLEYTFKSGQKEDVFRGDRLTFDVDSWEGVFFSGGMEGDRQVAGKQVRFRFEADSISKLRGSTVVLDRGTITSCDLPTNPHYHIKARKIWVLAPGEWAIASAVLHIGRVPVMYLPFFFRPGDEFFFHPAVGFREREGNFLQTTTYLIGQKARTPSALSVLAATEEQGQQYRRAIQGLFLRQPEGEQVPVTDNRFLKIFLDYYTRLGVFAGVSGGFPPKISFRSGLGVSRNIYKVTLLDGRSYYSPWPEGSDRSNWNDTLFLGLQVPFRYGLDGKWDLSGARTKLSGKFEYYSDPIFARDFYNRSEEMGLTRLLGMDAAESQTQTEGEKRALSWELNSQATLKTGGAGSLLKNLSLPYLNANLLWKSNLTGAVPEDQPDPTDFFYYPVSLKLPNAAVQISGDLLSLPLTGTPAAPPPARGQASGAPRELRLPGSAPAAFVPAEPIPEPRPPAEPARPAESEITAQPQAGQLRPPAPRERLADMPAPVPVSFSLSYQARPAVGLEQSFYFDEANWTEPGDVTYELAYTGLETSGTGSLDWALKVYESLFTLNGSLGLSGSYRTKYRRLAAEDASWQNLVLGDYRYSQLQVKNLLALNLSPFYQDPRFRTSKLSYTLNWLPFRYSLVEPAIYGSPVYNGQLADLTDAATFSQHQAEATFGWQAGKQASSLSVSAQLPPLAPTITGKVDASIWLLRTAVTTVFRETDNLWNLTVLETFQPSDKFRLSQELQADLNAWLWTRSVTSLAWGGFTSSFTALKPTAGTALEPANFSAGLKLAQTGIYFWKNRSRLESSINSSWSLNLYPNSIGLYDNNLTFSFILKYYLYKFLEFSLTTNSYNNRTYQYIPGFGPIWVNPLIDLLKSFNFFDIDDRKASAFKIRSVVVDMVHHMHDWDLTLRYEGKPLLETTTTGKPVYNWRNSFSILLQWIPIPELRNNLKADKDGFFIRD